MSSKYRMTIFQRRPGNTICIIRVNVLGALQKAKANFLHCHCLPPGIEKAVRCLSSSAISICQYPDFISRHEHIVHQNYHQFGEETVLNSCFIQNTKVATKSNGLIRFIDHNNWSIPSTLGIFLYFAIGGHLLNFLISNF